MACFSFYAQRLKVENTSIKDGEKLESISELVVSFDFTDVAESMGVDASTLGIASVMSDFEYERMLLYKGAKDSDYIGEIQELEDEKILGAGYVTIPKKIL